MTVFSGGGPPLTLPMMSSESPEGTAFTVPLSHPVAMANRFRTPHRRPNRSPSAPVSSSTSSSLSSSASMFSRRQPPLQTSCENACLSTRRKARGYRSMSSCNTEENTPDLELFLQQIDRLHRSLLDFLRGGASPKDAERSPFPLVRMDGHKSSGL